MWAITTYFNPCRYRSRRRNFELFRSQLGLPLLAIELGYGRYELDERAADRVVRVPGQDVMWQKERLQNLALAHLPASCDHVVFLDGDVIFDDTDWAERTHDALEHVPIVQPFSEAWEMDRGPLEGHVDLGRASLASSSFAWRLVHERAEPRELCRPRSTPSGRSWAHVGLAWAYRRPFLEGTGLYDAAIVGSGDRHMVCAATGCFEVARDVSCMTDGQYGHYLAWAQPFHGAAQGRIGCVPGRITHLWHGDLRDRRYHERKQILPRYDFDPRRDLLREDGQALRWGSRKPGLHRAVREYFTSRREDG